MKKLAVLGSILIGVTVLALIWKAKTDSASGTSQVYSELKKLDLNQFHQVEGHYFLLHFWAKWCEPCTDEIPDLVQFAEFMEKRQYPDGKPLNIQRPLKILAVSLDPTLEESKQILPDEGKRLPANFLLVLDAEQKFAGTIGSYQYPETYLVDPQGKILEKWIGIQKWLQPQVFDYFQFKLR